MNFNKTALFFFAATMALGPSAVFAGKKPAIEEIKILQKDLLKNKESINSLLNTRAHTISKEAESLIFRENLASAVRLVSLNAVKDSNTDEKVLEGQNAIDNMLRYYYQNNQQKSPVNNSGEKIYSLTVLNPDHLKIINKAGEEMRNLIRQDDDMLKSVGKYIDLSMKAKRYITYKEAAKVTDQIARMNKNLAQIESLSLSLKGREQESVESFRKNMDEFMNKKLVFVEVAKKGFSIDFSTDKAIYFPNIQTFGSSPMNKDYSVKNGETLLRNLAVNFVTQRWEQDRWDDFKFKHANVVYKFTVKEVESLTVTLSEDMKVATLQTKKYYFNTNVAMIPTATLKVSMDGKEIYDHESQNTGTYYSPNVELVRAQLQLVKAQSIAMKGIYDEFSFDNFEKDLGSAKFTTK